MADTLITGTTLVEKESRSIGDVPIGGIIKWDDTFANIPENSVLCDGSTITDPLSSYNGSAVPDLNTNYLSLSTGNFTAMSPDVDDISFAGGDGRVDMTGASVALIAGVNLPHGATVTSCIFYASVSTEDWELERTAVAGASGRDIMATAALNTADTSIIEPIINNLTHRYWISSDFMDATDDMYGAVITYTPRLKFIIRIK